MSDAPISYLPTDGLCYDPAERRYWNQEALAKEVERVFEVCHGCRLCFKYCDSFPTLFDLLDNKYDGDVRRVDDAETRQVMDACFQCKLCEVQCPYTPNDGHEFQLDFPELVHRFQAQKTRREGVKLQDRLFGDPDRLARVARASLGVANRMNRVPAHRLLMEKTLGIHRDKLLPPFADRTFESWARDRGQVRSQPGGEAVLFQTCYVQSNEPEIGRDTLEVLRHNGIETSCCEGLVCCGMPAWESGDLDRLRTMAKQNLDKLQPFVEAGAKVVAINPTCSMMIRRHWPTLVAIEDRQRAGRLAEAVVDPGELLWSIRNEDRFEGQAQSSPGETFAYHVPCHLRAQRIGFRSRDIIRKVVGSTPVTIMECCGHDGSHAMKVETYDAARRIGKKAFEGMKESDATCWVTDCPLAALQIEEHAGRRPIHPMTLLARAYRGDPFDGPEDER